MVECYYCSDIATSEEHIPPLCFFAGIKDAPKKLIKVPSCKAHNNTKTCDDEYFRNIISMHIEGGKESRDLFNKKTIKALLSTPKKYSEIMTSSHPILFNGLPTGKVDVDGERFCNYFTLMAYGLYYYLHKTKFNGEFEIQSFSFQEYSPENSRFRNLVEQSTRAFPKIGAYPQVFYFQEIIDDTKFYAIKLVFMGNITVLANNKKILDEIKI